MRLNLSKIKLMMHSLKVEMQCKIIKYLRIKDDFKQLLIAVSAENSDYVFRKTLKFNVVLAGILGLFFYEKYNNYFLFDYAGSMSINLPILAILWTGLLALLFAIRRAAPHIIF